MPTLFSELSLLASLTAPLPQNVLALARSSFSSLEFRDEKHIQHFIVIMGSGPDCPWDGNVELTERAWEVFGPSCFKVTVFLRNGMYPLALEPENPTKSLTISHHCRYREAREILPIVVQ
jgi:hypothetical protein